MTYGEISFARGCELGSTTAACGHYSLCLSGWFLAQTCISSFKRNRFEREDESEEDRFNNALLELKDLRSQLHHAADYCENAFSKAQHKKRVLEDTKNYICEAIVTVVDHLGTVSSKLEQSLLANSVVVQTEQRIDCLKQRLLACQQYTTNLELSTMKLGVIFPQHHEHYVSPVDQNAEKSGDISRTEGTKSREFETSTMKVGLSVMAHSPRYHVANHSISASNQKISGAALANAMPVIEGPSILSKPTNPSFNCKSELHMLEGVYQRKKQPLANNFLSFLRVSKRKA